MSEPDGRPGQPEVRPATHSPAGQEQWSENARGETQIQRLDRQFDELLQEVRVAQTGVQILFAFLLGFAFTDRFATTTTAQRVIYLVTLVLAALSAGLLIGPVSYHRMVFRRRLRAELVAAGHRYAMAGLTLLLLAVGGAIDLAATFVVGAWGAAIAAAVVVTIATLWWVVPYVAIRREQGVARRGL